MTVPDYPDWGTEAETARQVSIQGVPLLTAPSSLSNQTGLTLTASSSVTKGPFTFMGIGYTVSIKCQIPSAATSPFLKADMKWSDSVSGQTVAEEAWYLSCGSGADKAYIGKGPSKGDTLNITFTNEDSAQTITYALVVENNSRVYLDDDWRCMDGTTVPGFTLPTLFPASGILAQIATSVNPATTVDRLMNLYYGTVQFMSTLSATGSATLALKSRGPSQTFDQIFNSGVGGVLNTGPLTVALPRCPVLVEFTNNGSSAVTWSFYCNIWAKNN